MSKGGKKSTTSQTQTQAQSGTSTNTLDPQLQSALFGNYDRTVNLAGQGQTPFTGIGLQGALSAAGNLSPVTAGSYAPAMQTATTTGPAQTASASMGFEGINNYLNPYLNDVVDATSADLGRQRQIAQIQGAGAAEAAGAFGGSRHGVADALTNEAYDRNSGLVLGGLRSQGFNTALGAAQADADRRTGVSTFNAGQGNTLQALNAQLEAARSANNYGAMNRASEFNLNTNQAAQTQNQQAELARAGLLGNLGLQEYSQFQDQQNRPLTLQQLINQSLGLIPSFGTTSTSQTGTGTSKGTAKESSWGLSAGWSPSKGFAFGG